MHNAYPPMYLPLPYARHTHPHFDDVVALCIALASLVTTLGVYNRSGATETTNMEHAVHIGGFAARFSFHTYSMMHRIAHDGWPDEITLLKSQVQSPVEFHRGRDVQQPQMERLIGQLIGSAFMKFYESHAGHWKARMGNPKTWPDLWRFAWLVRNAIGHGDRFKIDDPTTPACTWSAFTITTSHNAMRWFDVDAGMLGGGDVFDLMNDLHETPLPAGTP